MYDCVGCGHIAAHTLTFTLYIEFYLVALIMFMVMQIYLFCQDVVRSADTLQFNYSHHAAATADDDDDDDDERFFSCRFE